MENRILTEAQKGLIQSLPHEILDHFYLAGGTALSAFYLEHRRSEDLDFFTDHDIQMPPVEFLLKIFQKCSPDTHIHFERLFDRRIFSVAYPDGEILKVEFTTYPFRKLEVRKRFDRLWVDTPMHIATGKLMAMTDRFDPKDFVDLYFLLKDCGWELDDLIEKTEERFGVKGLKYVVPERILLVKKIVSSELPMMIRELDLEQMRAFFLIHGQRAGRRSDHCGKG